ncbi:MAG: TlpA family protein disulfide reductase [Paludibacter sp.]|nr:TlpA family protein disulfide reductase [Paludibacter sp.]
MRLKILFLILILACANSEAKDNSKNYAFVIDGIVRNDSQKVVTITVQNLAIGKDLEFPLKINSNNAFHGKIELTDSIQYVIVSYKNEWIKLLVHSGDSIHIEFESSSLKKSIKFYGKAKEDNSLLIKFDTIPVIKGVPSGVYEGKWKTLSPNDYLKFCDSLYQESVEAYNDFTKKHKLSPVMERWMRNEVEYAFFNDKSSYPDNHRQLNNIRGYWNWDVADEYFDFQKSVHLSDIDLINSFTILPVIRNINFNYVDRKMMNESFIKTEDGHWARPDGLNDDSLMLHGIIKHVDNNLVRQLCLCERLAYMITSGETKKFEKYQHLISEYITNQHLKEQLLSYYRETKLRFENPELNTKAILKEISNTPAKSVIDSILLNNKGKVIYVDCWATWCGPCRGEIPYSKELMMKLKDLPVSFVFLCFDSEKDKWKAEVEKSKLGGTHYFIPKESGEYFKEAFSITGYPTYMLFDKNGNLISNNTIRPSEQDKIIEIIKQLTIK